MLCWAWTPCRLVLVYALHVSALQPPLAPLGVDDGVLDITRPPFSVDNSGGSDTTASIQAAIDFAHNRSLVAYFPVGTYLISDTIQCTSTFDWHTEENNTWPSRFTPHVLIGQHSGVGPRPRLVLAGNSLGFEDASVPKIVVHFATISYDPNNKQAKVGQEQANVNFNQLFRGIDIEVLAGNAGAIGIYHRAAQGSSVQDCTISMGSGHTGLAGAAGSGGSHAGVTVVGGRIGLDLSESQPAPTVSGMTLINQSQSAIVYNGGREALSAVGIQIVMGAGSEVAVSAKGFGSRWNTNINQMSFIDTSIDCSAAASNSSAFGTSASLYLRNVYTRACGVVVRSPSLVQPSPPASRPSKWSIIHELAAGVDVDSNNGYCEAWTMDLWLDGQRQPSPTLVNASGSSVASAPNFVARHLWDEESFPSFDHLGSHFVNVKDAPYHARGDGVTDDFSAIQRAIDSGAEVVLLPKGLYRISRTLVLGPSTKLIGVARTISVIMAMSDGLGGDVGAPRPLLHLPASSGQTVVAYITGVTWEHLGSVYGVQWDNHNHHSTWRQNYFYRITECLYGFPDPAAEPSRVPTMPCRPSALLRHPLNVVTGSGQFWNWENEDFLYEGPSYRHMLVANNTELDLVQFYQTNYEHADGAANMQVDHAHNVHLYSFKSENNGYTGNPNRGYALWISHSSNVNVYGHGGNALASTDAGGALYLVENSTDVRITNVVPQHEWAHEANQSNSVIFDKTAGVRTLECSRPVLFRISNPTQMLTSVVV